METAEMNQSEIRAELATAYAAGVLDPALTLLVHAQTVVAAPGARILGLVEATAGAMLEAETPAPLSPDALERVLAKIDAGPDEIAAAANALTQDENLMRELSLLPAALQDAAIRSLARRKWTRPLRGLHVLELDVGSFGGKAELIRVAPGMDIPRHTHGGPEYTLVLAGSFRDEGDSYGIGDICFADPQVTHTPKAEPGPTCWNLAVTYGALKWRDYLGLARRVLN